MIAATDARKNSDRNHPASESRIDIPNEVLAWAIDETRAWIEGQRAVHWPAGGQLPPVAKDAVRGFFTPAVLDRARVAVLAVIPNPPFLEQARAAGLSVEIDLSIMEGVTLADTILISQAVPPTDPLGLMFHELVHVVQLAVPPDTIDPRGPKGK